jgi:uncharacterized protein YcnI
MRSLITVASALFLVPAATAQVTLDPSVIPADRFSRFAVRVATERPNVQTTKVVMRLPAGLFFVTFQPKPGWRRTVTVQKLDPPVAVLGEMVSERVATVSWEGGSIAPGEFDEFGMSARVPAKQGVLEFPTAQTYSNGEVVRWIGAPDSDMPAPRVTLTPKVAEAAPPVSTRSTAPAETEDDGSETEGLALAVGIAGLVAGLVALAITFMRTRKPS